MSNLTPPIVPAINSPQRINKTTTSSPVRKKVGLKPGHSLLDWIRYGKDQGDLSGRNGNTSDVSLEELAKHNKKEDAWTSIKGKVYNITPYMDYHPGGEDELIRGAGIDGTALFEEYHQWVNVNSMMERCFVGNLSGSKQKTKRGSSSSLSSTGSITSDRLVSNGPKPTFKLPTAASVPRYDWFQTDGAITIVVYTKWREMKDEFVILDKVARNFLATLYIENNMFQIHLDLEEDISTEYDVKVKKDVGNVEIVLKKLAEKKWSSLGTNLPKHNFYKKIESAETSYRTCQIKSVTSITHDTRLFGINLPEGTRMCVPVGWHVHFSHEVSGMDINRSYTVVLPSLERSKQDDQQHAGRIFYLMIKIYNDGALTRWIGNLKEGDTVKVSNIEGKFNSNSLCDIKDLVMYAAGTGFTPMVRLMYHTLVEDYSQERNIKLMLFNKTERDIPWRKELDNLSESIKNFTVMYILSEPDDKWKGQTGRIRKELFDEFTPKVSDDSKTLICACGPTPFTKEVMRLAKEAGHHDKMLHAFLG